MSKVGFHISAGIIGGLGDCLRQCAGGRQSAAGDFSVDQDIWPDLERFSPQTVYIFRTQKNVRQRRSWETCRGRCTPAIRSRRRARLAEGDDAMWALNRAHYYAPLNEQDPAQIEGFTWLNAFTSECLNIAEANGYKLALYAFRRWKPQRCAAACQRSPIHARRRVARVDSIAAAGQG